MRVINATLGVNKCFPSDHILSQALALAGHGFKIFPLCYFDPDNPGGCGHQNKSNTHGVNCGDPGKRPIIEGWNKGEASNDPKQIIKWWTKWPNANIAILTGRELIVVDIDPRNGGDETFEDLQAEYGDFPDTVQVKTGGGGGHLYLGKDPSIIIPTMQKWRPGIDIKADGSGYVVAPGSLHKSGNTYEFEYSSTPENTKIAPAPAWLMDLLQEAQRAKEAREGLPAKGGSGSKAYDDLVRGVIEGARNGVLVKLGVFLKAQRCGEPLIRLLINAANQTYCDPPKTSRELEDDIFSWLFKKAKLLPSRRPGETEKQVKILQVITDNAQENNGGFCTLTQEEIAERAGVSARWVRESILIFAESKKLTVEKVGTHYRYSIPGNVKRKDSGTLPTPPLLIPLPSPVFIDGLLGLHVHTANSRFYKRGDLHPSHSLPL